MATEILNNKQNMPLYGDFVFPNPSFEYQSLNVLIKKGYRNHINIDWKNPQNWIDQPTSVGIRYIRDWVNGSTSNAGNHWVEIKAIDNLGTNIAQGKPVTSNKSFIYSGSYVTDGNTSSSRYQEVTGNTYQYVQIDLGGIYEIDKVQVWHYYADGRTYYGTKTEISADGTTWYTLYDSAVSGTYKETSYGKEHIINYVNFPDLVITNDGFFQYDETEDQLRQNTDTVSKILNTKIPLNPNDKWVLQAKIKQDNNQNKFSIGTYDYYGDQLIYRSWWGQNNKTVSTINEYELYKNAGINNQIKTGTSQTGDYKWRQNTNSVSPIIVLNRSGQGTMYLKDLQLYNIIEDQDFQRDYENNDYVQIKTHITTPEISLTYNDYPMEEFTTYTYKLDYLNENDEIIETQYYQIKTQENDLFANMSPYNLESNVSINNPIFSFDLKYDTPNAIFELWLGTSETNLEFIKSSQQNVIMLNIEDYLLQPNTRYFYKIKQTVNSQLFEESPIIEFNTQDIHITLINPQNNSIDNIRYPIFRWDCNYYSSEVLFTLKLGKDPNNLDTIKINIPETEFDLSLNKELYYMEFDTTYYYQVTQRIRLYNLNITSPIAQFRTHKSDVQEIQFYHGLESRMPTYAKLQEPLFTKDTGRLFIGNGEFNPLTEVTNKKIVIGENIPQNPLPNQIYIDTKTSPQKKYIFDAISTTWIQFDKELEKIGDLKQLQTESKNLLTESVNDIYKQIYNKIINFNYRYGPNKQVILSWRNPLNYLLIHSKIYKSSIDLSDKDYNWCNENQELIGQKFGGINSYIEYEDTLGLHDFYYYKIFQEFYTDDTKTDTYIDENNSQYLKIPSKDLSQPGNIDELSAIPYDGKITLSWINPKDQDWKGTTIVRSTFGYPNSNLELLKIWRDEFDTDIRYKYIQKIFNGTQSWVWDINNSRVHSGTSNKEMQLIVDPTYLNMIPITRGIEFHVSSNYLGTSDDDLSGLCIYDQTKNEYYIGGITNNSYTNGISKFTNTNTFVTLATGPNFNVKLPHKFDLYYSNGTLRFYVDDSLCATYNVDLQVTSFGLVALAQSPAQYFGNLNADIYYTNGQVIKDFTDNRLDRKGLYVDEDVVNGVVYYYTLFPYDSNYNFRYSSKNRIQQTPMYITTISITNLTSVNLDDGENMKVSWTNQISDFEKTYKGREVYVSKKDLTNLSREDCYLDTSEIYPVQIGFGTGEGTYDEQIVDISQYMNNEELYIKQFTNFIYNNYNYYDEGVTITHTVLDDTDPPASYLTLIESFENEVRLQITHPEDVSDYAYSILIKSDSQIPYEGVINLKEETIRNNLSGYTILGNILKGTTTFSDKDVQVGKTYYYKAISVDTSGNQNNNTNTITTTIQISPLYVKNFISSDTYSETHISLKWEDPSETDFPNWDRTVIVRNANRIPQNINDGRIIVIEYERNLYKDVFFVDNSVEVYQTYYYRQFTIDTNGFVYDRQIRSTQNMQFNTPPSPVIIDNVLITDKEVMFQWQDSQDQDWSLTRVVKDSNLRNLNPYTSESLGINTIRNQYSSVNNKWFVDSNVTIGRVYNYGIYPADNLNAFNTNPVNTIQNVRLQTLPQPINNSIEININGDLVIRTQMPADGRITGCHIFFQTEDLSNLSYYECLTNPNAQTLFNSQVSQVQSIIRTYTNVVIGETYYQKIFPKYVYNNFNYIGSPVTLTYDTYNNEPPSPITNFTQVNSESQIILSWENPEDFDYDRLIIVKNSDHMPINVNDGIQIGPLSKTTTTFTDSNITVNQKYYYKQFTYDVFDNVQTYGNQTVVQYQKNESDIQYINNEGNQIFDYQLLITIPDQVINDQNQVFTETQSNILVKDFYGNTLPYVLEDFDNKTIWVKFSRIDAIKDQFYFDFDLENEVSYNYEDVFIFYEDFNNQTLDETKWDIQNISPEIDYELTNGTLKINTLNSTISNMIDNRNSIQFYIPLNYDIVNNKNIIIEDYKTVEYKELSQNIFSSGVCILDSDNKVLSSNVYFDNSPTSQLLRQGNVNGNYYFVGNQNYNAVILDVNSQPNKIQKTQIDDTRIYAYLLDNSVVYQNEQENQQKIQIQIGRYMQYDIPYIYYHFVRIRKFINYNINQII